MVVGTRFRYTMNAETRPRRNTLSLLRILWKRRAKEEAFGDEFQCRIIVFTRRHTLWWLQNVWQMFRKCLVVWHVARCTLQCDHKHHIYLSIAFQFAFLFYFGHICSFIPGSVDFIWRQAICLLQTHNHKLCKYFAKNSI